MALQTSTAAQRQVPLFARDHGNAPRRFVVSDKFALTERRRSPEGFLIAPAKLSRTGVQEYTAGELGLDESSGMATDAIVRLFRPHEEVFSAAALSSFEAATLTINHPPDNVTAANWKTHAVGDVHGIASDGKHMTGRVVVKDKDAIKSILDGKTELSMGYSFELDMTPGTAPDGTEYHGIQRAIRANHAAVVDFARGGSALRIADHQPSGDTNMALKTITVGDGINLELEPTVASVVEAFDRSCKKAIKDSADAVVAADKARADAEAKLKAADDAGKALVADHAAKIAELQAKILTPEQVEALAAERAKVVGDAAKLAPEFEPEGKTVAQIRAEVLTQVIASDEALKPIATAMLGGVDVAKASETVIKAAFDGCAASRDTANDTSAHDADVARVLTGNGRVGGSRPSMTSLEIMKYRQNHGGKSPNDKATA